MKFDFCNGKILWQKFMCEFILSPTTHSFSVIIIVLTMSIYVALIFFKDCELSIIQIAHILCFLRGMHLIVLTTLLILLS